MIGMDSHDVNSDHHHYRIQLRCSSIALLPVVVGKVKPVVRSEDHSANPATIKDNVGDNGEMWPVWALTF